MPDPQKYKDEKEFMEDCMHQVKKVEGKPQDQALGQCFGMWENKKGAEEVMSIEASISKKNLSKAVTTALPVVFLGGECKDNSWRKEIIKEFGDPYDEKYDVSVNTYFEIAGMLKSDYVIFYKGGVQTKREQNFLKLLGEKNIKVREVKNLKNLKDIMRKISKKKKLSGMGSKIKKCAESLLLNKEAVPHVLTPNSKDHVDAVDLHFEYLDSESRAEVAKDLLSGATVKVPKYVNNSYTFENFSLGDIDKNSEGLMLSLLKKLAAGSTIDTKGKPHLFKYDKITKTYTDSMVKVAKLGVKYSYACAMVPLSEKLSEEVMSWGEKNIADKDLYVEKDGSHGREDQIHVTLLYGIVSDDPKVVEKYLSSVKPFEIRLGLINIFKDNEKYDVLKIEVESGDLEKLHYDMRSNIKNKNTYPTYNPHVTIAYVKKSKSDKYIGDDSFKGKILKVDSILFCDSNNQEIKISLDRR
jgi:2'-5' RNA ligase